MMRGPNSLVREMMRQRRRELWVAGEFCYPDGGESNACVALAGDRATLLGSLTPERD